jgi:AcrR family transcriptional regulator
LGRREDNKRKKREALESAALAAFRSQGYEAASIEQIAQAAGVARGTFYLYFPDKLALFDALMDRWYEPVLGVLADVAAELDRVRTGAEVLEVYRDLALNLAPLILAHAQSMEVAFRESRQPGEAGQSLRKREHLILDRVTAYTRSAADRGLIRVRDPRLFSAVVYGAVERLVYEAMLGTDLGDPVLVADDVLSLFAMALGLPQLQERA